MVQNITSKVVCSTSDDCVVVAVVRPQAQEVEVSLVGTCASLIRECLL